MASTISAFLVAGCGSNDMPGNGAPPDMAMGNTPPDMSNNGPKPDLAPPPCDPVAQDCTDPNDSKCTLVDDGSGMKVIPMCVMPTGTKMTDDPCTRLNNTPTGVGHDDCAKGDYCSGSGTLSNPPVRHCRSFCLSNNDCKNSEICIGAVLNATMTAFSMGLCVPSCSAFGTDCGQGLNCSNLVPDVDALDVHLACRQPGSVPNGGSCTSDLDCAADTICIVPKKGANPTCSALCDTNHACANGETCFRYLMDVPASTVFACVRV